MPYSPQGISPHKVIHQHTGLDEISLAALGGEPSTLTTHKAATDAHIAEVLANLLEKANILHIPLNYGWGVTDGGGAEQHSISKQFVKTATTANTSYLMYAELFGFAVGGSTYANMNWDKKLYFIFNYLRGNSDAEAVARLQLKQATTLGALGAKGIGIRLDNYALQGESYGTSLGVVDLATTLTSYVDKQIVIVHSPSVPKIEWFVDGVLKGTQSTAACIPTGMGSSDLFLVHSVNNGATGGVGVYSIIMHPKLWQAR